MPDQGQKLCSRCRCDVAGKPRTKDKQGRYFCADCVKALRAKRAASGAAPIVAAAPLVSGPGDVMAGLVDDAVSHLGAPCPACQSPMPEGAVMCTRCGHNVASGKNMKTRVEKAPKEKKVKSEGGGGGGIGLSTWLPAGLGLGFIGLFGMGFVDPLYFLAFGLAFLVVTFVVWVTMIACAFMDGEAGWGVAIIFLSWVPLIGWYLQIKYVTEVSGRPTLQNTVVTMVLLSFFTGAFFKFAPDSLIWGEEDAWVDEGWDDDSYYDEDD